MKDTSTPYFFLKICNNKVANAPYCNAFAADATSRGKHRRRGEFGADVSRAVLGGNFLVVGCRAAANGWKQLLSTRGKEGVGSW